MKKGDMVKATRDFIEAVDDYGNDLVIYKGGEGYVYGIQDGLCAVDWASGGYSFCSADEIEVI